MICSGLGKLTARRTVNLKIIVHLKTYQQHQNLIHNPQLPQLFSYWQYGGYTWSTCQTLVCTALVLRTPI